MLLVRKFYRIGNYIFQNNGEGNISYYKKIIEGYLEVFSQDKNGCIKCNNSKGYFKIENQEYKCSNKPPAENYIFDKESKEWRLCNKRCQKCYIQSRSELDHQCFICTQNYYPYKIDFENFINNKITGFNCFNISEVKSQYLNYFLNSDNQLEKCDISCQECESKNLCLKCSDNYYYIYGHENGTCYKEPLPYYGLIYINNNLFFKNCFNLCKYCYKITKSFLFQQCRQCDEIDYTLDIYSLNESFCIPKDKSKSYFIKDKTKWYINENNDFEELIINDKNLIIDYEKLLDNIKFINLTYKIVDNCPDDKPYIIYSIRQCVSSCNSQNLIENGLFMTKKLYLYNNICYDECPFGSIKDNDHFICKEINKYIVNNTNISLEYFKENNVENILKYLAESANNSVEIVRNNDFSNYFYNQTTNLSFKIELQMPIFDFSNCLKKLKSYHNISNINIFYGILEYNDQINKNGKYNKNSNLINSTSYQIFLENGTILDYSICKGITIKVEKKVETKKIKLDELKEIEDKYNFSIFNKNSKELNDYCIPLSINNKDLTVYERNLLAIKYKAPCDDDCIFQSFNYTTNYSTCLCQIKDDDEKSIKDKIIEEINQNDKIKQLKKLLNDGNLKYFKCFFYIFKIKKKNNWLIYISLFHLILQIISIILYYKKNHNIILKEYDEIIEKVKNHKNLNDNESIKSQKTNTNKIDKKKQLILIEKDIKYAKSSESKLIKTNKNLTYNRESLQMQNNKYINDQINFSEKNDNIPQNIQNLNTNPNTYSEKNQNIIKGNDNSKINFQISKNNDQRKFCVIFCNNLNSNSILIINNIKNSNKKFFPAFLIILLYNISFHTYLFFNAILFSDKYISERNQYKKGK